MWCYHTLDRNIIFYCESNTFINCSEIRPLGGWLPFYLCTPNPTPPPPCYLPSVPHVGPTCCALFGGSSSFSGVFNASFPLPCTQLEIPEWGKQGPWLHWKMFTIAEAKNIQKRHCLLAENPEKILMKMPQNNWKHTPKWNWILSGRWSL